MAIKLYEEMKEDNIECDAVFYNTFISGLIFNKYIKEAIIITYESME